MKIIGLPYNKSFLELALPDSAIVVTLSPREVSAIPDPQAELIRSLENPTDGPGIDALVNGLTGNVLIIVPDHTRVCGKEISIPWILDLLESRGVDPKRITVLVALGSHKPIDTSALEISIGPAYSRAKVIQHDPSGDLTDYGFTSRGTPIKINSLFSEAELVILYTSVVHHYFAGFGGGPKMIMPGIASLDSISANHSLVFEGSGEGGGRHPMVKSGQLSGNPVHDDMLEAALRALEGKKYISINVAMTQSKEFAFITAGSLDKAHRTTCDFVDAQNNVTIDCLADLVIASAGGFPKDSNVIQSHKGLDNAVKALKPGGTILYLMGCSQGSGNPAVDRFALLDKKAIREELARDYVVYGQTVYAIKEKTSKFRVIALTGLDHDMAKSLGFIPTNELGNAMLLIESEIPGANLIYHIPRADMTVPRLVGR